MKTLTRVLLLFISLLLTACASDRGEKNKESERLNAVISFADNVLEKGRDRWSGRNTPLLAGGINIETGAPLEYVYDGSEGLRGEGGKPQKWIIHDLAGQQNLFRTLVTLSNITGDPKYRQAAEKSIRFHFDSLPAGGLLHWGGHEIIDLHTLKPVGHAWRQNVHSHELKDVYPYYELMWQVDPEKTAVFIRSFWNAHVLDWNRLEFNRHGVYNKKMGPLWNSEYHEPEPFFEGEGLTFLNTGSDLIYAGSILYTLNSEEGALTWSTRLAGQYVRARHPKTGLGSYQFSKPKRHKQPPDGPLEGLLTYSEYGDRAENQFGRDFPGVAREGWALFDGAGIYTLPALMQMELAEKLGDRGNVFKEWTLSGLENFARYGYIPADNTFRPMWADGTDLTGYKFTRTGYYGPEGRVLKASKADELYLFTYTRAMRLSYGNNPRFRYLWEIVRSMWKGLGLGDPGTQHAKDMNFETTNSSPYLIFALLEHHKMWRDKESLKLAERVGNNLMARSYRNGYFLKNGKSKTALFDAIEPLALLALETALRGESEKVPIFSGGSNNLDLKTE